MLSPVCKDEVQSDGSCSEVAEHISKTDDTVTKCSTISAGPTDDSGSLKCTVTFKKHPENDSETVVLWKDGDIEVHLGDGDREESGDSFSDEDKTTRKLVPDEEDNFIVKTANDGTAKVCLRPLILQYNGKHASIASSPRKTHTHTEDSDTPCVTSGRRHAVKKRTNDLPHRSRHRGDRVRHAVKRNVDRVQKVKSEHCVEPSSLSSGEHSDSVKSRHSARCSVSNKVVHTHKNSQKSDSDMDSSVASLNLTVSVAEPSILSTDSSCSLPSGRIRKPRVSQGIEYLDEDDKLGFRRILTSSDDFSAEQEDRWMTPDKSTFSVESCDVTSKDNQADGYNEQNNSQRHNSICESGEMSDVERSKNKKKRRITHKIRNDESHVRHAKHTSRKRSGSHSVDEKGMKLSIVLGDNMKTEKEDIIKTVADDDSISEGSPQLTIVDHVISKDQVKEERTESDGENMARCTTEEVFRKIEHDSRGRECRYCHCEMRTRAQMVHHGKGLCQQQSSPRENEPLPRNRRTSEVENTPLKPERRRRHTMEMIDVERTSVAPTEKLLNIQHAESSDETPIKNCIIEIGPLPKKVDENAESVSETPCSASKADPECVCDGCGEVVPDCSWLTAHIVTCPGRTGTGDDISVESFQPGVPAWNGDQQDVTKYEPAASDPAGQPGEVDAASLLQLLCSVESSLQTTTDNVETHQIANEDSVVKSEEETCGGIVAVVDGESDDVEKLGRKVEHDGVTMYEFMEYRCSGCPVTFADKSAAAKHTTSSGVHGISTVVPVTVYCCLQCDMRYCNQHLMWYHITYICEHRDTSCTPHNDDLYRCGFCSKVFMSLEYLNRHLRLRHASELLATTESHLGLTTELLSDWTSGLATAKMGTVESQTTSKSAANESEQQTLLDLACSVVLNGVPSIKNAADNGSESVGAATPSKSGPATLPVRRTAKGIVYKNVFMQCIVSYICSNCGRDLSAKTAKREHRAAAPSSCFDAGPGGRRLFTYVRHYSYLCPYCGDRATTQKACRAHQLTTCLPRLGVKTDELNHKQLLCPFCQRKYFNVITLKGHMTLVHQIGRAESHSLLSGITGMLNDELIGGLLPDVSGSAAARTLSAPNDNSALKSSRSLQGEGLVTQKCLNRVDDDGSVGDTDSHRSSSVSRDAQFETVDPSLPLLSSSSDVLSVFNGTQNNSHCTNSAEDPAQQQLSAANRKRSIPSWSRNKPKFSLKARKKVHKKL